MNNFYAAGDGIGGLYGNALRTQEAQSADFWRIYAARRAEQEEARRNRLTRYQIALSERDRQQDVARRDAAARTEQSRWAETAALRRQEALNRRDEIAAALDLDKRRESEDKFGDLAESLDAIQSESELETLMRGRGVPPSVAEEVRNLFGETQNRRAMDAATAERFAETLNANLAAMARGGMMEKTKAAADLLREDGTYSPERATAVQEAQAAARAEMISKANDLVKGYKGRYIVDEDGRIISTLRVPESRRVTTGVPGLPEVQGQTPPARRAAPIAVPAPVVPARIPADEGGGVPIASLQQKQAASPSREPVVAPSVPEFESAWLTATPDEVRLYRSMDAKVASQLLDGKITKAQSREMIAKVKRDWAKIVKYWPRENESPEEREGWQTF